MSKKNDKQAALLAAGWILDRKLGHRLPDGHDFIGEKDFISLQQQLEEIKSSKKKIILSIGDSSTSGWDMNVYFKNIHRVKKGLQIKPGFFSYKTYTDMLRDQIGNKFIVINAGVPAYSSLQGAIRLDILLKIFKKHGVKISYVISYFGNNDSNWRYGVEDKYWIGLPKSKENFDKSVHDEVFNRSPALNRVLPKDYKINLINIINQCRSQNIVPIFLEPVSSIYWKPDSLDNKRSLLQSSIYNNQSSQLIKDLLAEAHHLWEIAIKEKQYSEMKQLLLEEAREKDFLLARIKKSHLKALRDVVSVHSVPYVAITLDRTENDSRYFIDSHHPIGHANKLFANGIKRVIIDFEQGKRKDSKKVPKVSQSQFESSTVNFADYEVQPSLSQYPLY